MKRDVFISPAFDKRHPDPAKNYGIGSCQIRFVLTGELGAVQFLMGTDWYLPHLKDAYRSGPQAWDLGYHSPTPIYEGQEPMRDECSFIGGRCYYDGSSLNAEPVLELLITQGSEAVWKRLEEFYRETFESEAA